MAVSDKGEVCLQILDAKNWRAATMIHNVLEELVKLLQHPEPDHALDQDVAKVCVENPEAFAKEAQKWTKKHASK